MEMVRRKSVFRRTAMALAFLTAWASVGVPRVQAMMVPSPVASEATAQARAQDLAAVRTALENKMVRQRLADLGLSSDQIDARLGRLSDRQLHQVAMHIEKQNPAGDATGILVIVVLVLLIIYLAKRI